MKAEKGVSLIESLLVIVVVGSIVFLIANIPNALMLVAKAKHMSLAREIAVKQIEDKKTIQFANLVNDTANITDPRLSLLPTGAGTILVEDCDVIICSNGEKIKQVTVTVTWKDNSKTQTVNLKTMIGEGGINQ